jgi:hypothetical protein
MPPSLTIEDQVRFTFPLPDGSGGPFSFLLFSTEGDVPKVSAQVRQVKTPDGVTLPIDAARAALEKDTVTPEGVKVSLTLEPKYFTTPGEYRIFLFFRSATGTPSLSGTIVINRPAADINVDELKDQTVALTRPLPFLTANNEFRLYVRETTAKAPLNELKVVGQSVYIKDTKEFVPGNVSAAFVPDASAQAQTGIPAGAVKTLQVNLSDLRYTGAFDTRLLITSTGFSGAKTIPVKITVQDFVLFPLLAIALGVLAGYWTRRLIGVVRPRNQNNLEILRLQNEIERFREAVKKPASRETVQNLLARLRRAKENNETGDFVAVREELTKVREQFEEFRKAQVQAEGEAQTTLSSLSNQVEVLEQNDDTLTTEETRDLHSIKDKLADIERLLRLGMVEDAQIKIDNVKQLLGDLRSRKLATYFTELKVELSKLTLAADAQARSETLQAEVQALLNSNELDNARAKLEELKSFVEVQKELTRPRRGREADTEAAGLPEVPAILPRAASFTHIEISTAPEDRIAGATITFTIVDVEKIIQPDDQLRWFFGDVGSFETQNVNASHAYTESGRFQVRVEIIRNEELVVKTLTEMITLLPGAIEQLRATIIQDIVRNERVLSAIALVLAIIGGVIFLYSGKLFGSLIDYLGAILWGFGLDNSVKGFAAVLKKISTEA